MNLLIVGSLKGYITTAGKIAISRGAKVVHVDDEKAAMDYLRSGGHVELLMVDVDLDIGKIVKACKDEHINISTVACGIDSNPDVAVKAIKAGAKEYIPLPPDPEMIAAVLEAVSDEGRNTIFKDPKTKQAFDLALKVAHSDASILITGESGTGKEVMARYIHDHSPRKDKPFISVNCAAIPDNLLESELFGHEKGAFTGAVSRRIGKFEQANNGTLLLDEITEMDLRLQAKLLRAIQEREIDRVGGTTPVKVNIRLLATSNRDLKKAVDGGRFREDLYFRLNVININMPSLRDRRGDIEPLARYFMEKYAKANGVNIKGIDGMAIDALRNYDWPGNVRELENTIQRAVILARGEMIKSEDLLLPDSKSNTPDAVNNNAAKDGKSDLIVKVGNTLADVEKELILSTLDHCLGNKTHAANILGISIRTLRNKLHQYEKMNEEELKEDAGTKNTAINAYSKGGYK